MVIAQSARSKTVPEYSVRQIGAFSSLPDSVVQNLDSMLAPSSRSAGEILYSQNEKPSGLHMLFDGSDKLTAVVATGKTALLRISGEGDLLGLNAVLAQRPYLATARVLNDCQLGFIGREELVSLMNRHSELALSMVERLAVDCAEALTEMLFLRVPTSTLQRLAMLLLRLSDAKDLRRHGVPVLYTQAEIAQMVGASRETVTRLLSQLERKGEISVSRSKLKILDQPALKKIAKIC